MKVKNSNKKQGLTYLYYLKIKEYKIWIFRETLINAKTQQVTIFKFSGLSHSLIPAKWSLFKKMLFFC